MELEEFLKSQGYEDVQYIEGWGWCGLNRYIFTYGVLYGMNYAGFQGRFCFDTKGNAKAFYKELVSKKREIEIPIVGQDGCTAIK